MRKGVIGLVVLFSLSLFPAYSATPPKAGSICSKQGLTKNYQGKKYTCIKSGKKLVWGKGVVVKKSIPTPTPTPTATPTQAPTPTPSPTSTPFPIPSVSSSPTPTPTLEFQISGSDSLLPASACRLSDSSGNNFHLGFPITPIIKDLSRIRIFAVPFEFSDSTNFRLSKEQTDKMFDSIKDYYIQESYGKTRLEFAFPPNKTGSGEFQALSFDFELKESIFKPNFRFRDADVTSYINQLLSKTELTWNLGSYDSVILYSQDSRTFNLFGGQAWRGTEDSKINQSPFDSPSGKIRSLVFASGIPSVMIHELGHSLFGFIDLYDQNAGQLFAQGWGLLASAYTGEMNLRGWEKWLTGWISTDEVRCTNVQSLHYLKFIASQSNSPKLLIHPLDIKRAVVVEAIDTNLIAQENRGYLNFCNKVSFCLPHKRTGLLAYTIDVSKLSALGSVVVPEILKFPDLLADGNEIAVSGVIVKNLGCDRQGCFVSVRR